MNFVSKSAIQPRANHTILIYGPTGVGKTTLALGSTNPALLDFDGGVTRVNPLFWTDMTAQVTAWEGYNVMVQQIMSCPADTIIIDTASKMLDMIQSYVMQINPKFRNLSKPSLQAYGEIKVEYTNFLKQVRTTGKNLIFVAQEVEMIKSTPSGDVHYHMPECGSDKNRTYLLQDLDLVGYIFKDGPQTYITFSQTDAWYGKNTCGLAERIAIPVISNGEQNTVMETIQDVWKNRQLEIAGGAKKIAAQLDAWLARVEDVKESIDANILVDDVKAEQWLNGNRVKVVKALDTRCKELGMTFNKEEGRYE